MSMMELVGLLEELRLGVDDEKPVPFARFKELSAKAHINITDEDAAFLNEYSRLSSELAKMSEQLDELGEKYWSTLTSDEEDELARFCALVDRGVRADDFPDEPITMTHIVNWALEARKQRDEATN